VPLPHLLWPRCTAIPPQRGLYRASQKMCRSADAPTRNEAYSDVKVGRVPSPSGDPIGKPIARPARRPRSFHHTSGAAIALPRSYALCVSGHGGLDSGLSLCMHKKTDNTPLYGRPRRSWPDRTASERTITPA
jgi:hypothetical protein